jgi:hypothetical protein
LTVESKTTAFAAFLGNSDLWRQFEFNCCMEDTFLGLNWYFSARFQALEGHFTLDTLPSPLTCEKLSKPPGNPL